MINKIQNLNIVSAYKLISKFFKYILLSLGVIFTIIIVLSFTELPFWMYYNLGVSNKKLTSPPDYIILMGGSGFPSESNLMRCYQTVKSHNKYPKAKIIIALPGNLNDTTSSVILLKKEIIKYTDYNNIIVENKGTNTRMQALNIKKLISDSNSVILLISSPEHMYRARKTFEKVGFSNVYIQSAYEKAIDTKLSFDADSLGGNKFVPDIGNDLSLRYQFWNHLKYQVIVYREYFAITYYYLKSWI